MSRARVAVLKVISKELSATYAAAQYGYSRQHLHRLIARYKAGGLDAVEPRSRRPKSNPQATEDKVRDFIIATRLELTAAGWDAGPVTIAWHLERLGCTSRRPRRSGASCTPPPWSPPSLRSGPAPPACASRPPSPTSAGSPTSPTGRWPAERTRRSSTGSMTTPATCWPPAPTPRSPGRSSSTRSCRPATPTGCPPRP
jgi:hypothetical protein